MRKFLYISLLLLVDHLSFCQDSTIVLTYERFLEIVRTEHPMIRKIELTDENADAILLEARGGFDPKITADLGQKYFQDKKYYSLLNEGFKIPTWYGVELQGGFENNSGYNLNPEHTTPQGGLIYAGVSVPILQGLLIDKRRAELKKAKIYRDVNEQEQLIMLNDLIFEASQAYWNWFEAFHNFTVYTDAYDLAKNRFEMVKANVVYGYYPAIDSVEAFIQLQNIELNLIDSRVNLQNANYEMSKYLWLDGQVPIELETNTKPIDLITAELVEIEYPNLQTIDTVIWSHPLLTKESFVLDQYEVSRRLKMEYLKPKVNLKFNPITEAIGNNTYQWYSINDYTWGLQLSMPLLLRTERGQYKQSVIKIQDKQLDISLKQNKMKYTALKSINKFEGSQSQLKASKNAVSSSQILVEAERKLFNIGESSMYMINSREKGLIEAQKTQIKMLAKYQLAAVQVKYDLGNLN